MKNKLLLLVLSLCTLSCNTSEPPTEQQEGFAPSRAEVEEPTPASAMLGPSPNQTTPTEYIEWDSIKINNLLTLDSNTREVMAVFGKADSTVSPDYENMCSNCHFCNEDIPAFRNAYYRGVEFEQLNDSLVFWSADFSLNKSLFLQSGSMRFDHKTTLEEIRKLFPESVKEVNKETKTDWIRISPSKQPVDGDFILEFNKDGYLTKFYYWFPC